MMVVLNRFSYKSLQIHYCVPSFTYYDAIPAIVSRGTSMFTCGTRWPTRWPWVGPLFRPAIDHSRWVGTQATKRVTWTARILRTAGAHPVKFGVFVSWWWLIMGVLSILTFNSYSTWQDGHQFTDDVSRCIFMNETFCILNRLSLKFVPEGLINNIPALVQIMASGWRRSGDKPSSQPMLTLFTEAYMRH